jgi:hypothetical protein
METKTVNETRIVKRLIFDCGFKRNSEFRCVVCNKRKRAPTKLGEDGKIDYTIARPMMVEHIILTHPDYCYKCNKCNDLFVTKKEMAQHKKNHK